MLAESLHPTRPCNLSECFWALKVMPELPADGAAVLKSQADRGFSTMPRSSTAIVIA